MGHLDLTTLLPQNQGGNEIISTVAPIYKTFLYAGITPQGQPIDLELRGLRF